MILTHRSQKPELNKNTQIKKLKSAAKKKKTEAKLKLIKKKNCLLTYI